MGKPRKIDKCYEGKPDCFALSAYGKCKACIETDFVCDCPFYKTAEERRAGHIKAVKHLEEIGRQDLIEKYGHEGDQPRVWGDIW